MPDYTIVLLISSCKVAINDSDNSGTMAGFLREFSHRPWQYRAISKNSCSDGDDEFSQRIQLFEDISSTFHTHAKQYHHLTIYGVEFNTDRWKNRSINNIWFKISLENMIFTWQESWDVHEGDDGDVKRIAEPYEPRSLH